jgi:hypothetical protein
MSEKLIVKFNDRSDVKINLKDLNEQDLKAMRLHGRRLAKNKKPSKLKQSILDFRKNETEKPAPEILCTVNNDENEPGGVQNIQVEKAPAPYILQQPSDELNILVEKFLGELDRFQVRCFFGFLFFFAG